MHNFVIFYFYAERLRDWVTYILILSWTGTADHSIIGLLSPYCPKKKRKKQKESSKNSLHFTPVGAEVCSTSISSLSNDAASSGGGLVGGWWEGLPKHPSSDVAVAMSIAAYYLASFSWVPTRCGRGSVAGFFRPCGDGANPRVWRAVISRRPTNQSLPRCRSQSRFCSGSRKSRRLVEYPGDGRVWGIVRGPDRAKGV